MSQGDVSNAMTNRALDSLRNHLESGSITLIRLLGGGYTDAAVMLVDLSCVVVDRGTTSLEGQYIVKSELRSSGNQATAHASFLDALGDFGRAHVPALVVSYIDADIAVDIYEIAGLSINSVRSSDKAQPDEMELVLEATSVEYLQQQILAATAPRYDYNMLSALEAMLGISFWVPKEGSRLHAAKDALGIDGVLFHSGMSLVLDPLRFIEHYGTTIAVGIIEGPCHGDLHLRNIMVDGTSRYHTLKYFLIDVLWDRPGAIGYDQQYLMFSLMRHYLAQHASLEWTQILECVYHGESRTRTHNSFLTKVIADQVRAWRRTLLDTAIAQDGRRRDLWDVQVRLSGIGALLNWARKPISLIERQMAYLWASYAMTDLVQEYYPDLWLLVTKNAAAALSSPGDAEVNDEEASRFTTAWQTAMDDSRRDRILVAGALSDEKLKRILRGPDWDLVFDFDPNSTETGLGLDEPPSPHPINRFGHAGMLPVAKGRTSWYMADGWTSRAEAPAGSFADWRRRRMPVARDLIDTLVRESPHTRATIVLAMPEQQHRDSFNRILEHVDECYDGELEVIHIQDANPDCFSARTVVVTLETVAVSAPMEETPTLPGRSGRIAIDWPEIARMAIDVEILHSAVGDVVLDTTDEFWRGRPPEWIDIAAGLDIPRAAVEVFERNARSELSANPSTVLRLQHAPGAGGTTVARRVCWNIKDDFPVVSLRRHSRFTAEHIGAVFHLTGLPVLVLAEEEELSEAELDQLLSDLTTNNVRFLILHVARSRGGSSLPRPMPADECKAFQRSFEVHAKRKKSLTLLQQLGRGAVSGLPSACYSPFFFGLTAFDSNYLGARSYVAERIQGLTMSQKKGAVFLALLSRYSQKGLPTEVANDWFQFTVGESSEPLRLPPGLRELVYEVREEVRVLHPFLAEEMLHQLLGGGGTGWRVGLASVSIDLINAFATESLRGKTTTRKLLESLFIQRSRWGEDGASNFSDLIRSIPSKEAAHEVLKALAAAFPDEPHYWNHLGRHHILAMKSDFEEAEQLLLRAVELSSSRDPLHFHTLGMVRRLWVQDASRRIAIERGSLEDLMAAILPLFDDAIGAFEEGRSLDPRMEHFYITPVQLIEDALSTVVRRSGLKSLPEFLASGSEYAGWATEQLALAESLLETYENLKAGSRKESKYYRRCILRLDELYGDAESLIQQWKAVAADSTEMVEVGRALARVIFASGGRNWALLSEQALRDIAGCLSDIVVYGNSTDSDLRQWFQAYRRLPEYNESVAIQMLASVADSRVSVDANYYLYVIHFLRWLRRDAGDQAAAIARLEKTKALAQDVPTSRWSYEWVGLDEASSSLVHFSELGERTGEDDFFKERHKLGRIDGFIRRILGGKAGTIAVAGGRMDAFFAPRTKFLASRDVNAEVTFFLGFSYVGLRAWEPDFK